MYRAVREQSPRWSLWAFWTWAPSGLLAVAFSSFYSSRTYHLKTCLFFLTIEHSARCKLTIMRCNLVRILAPPPLLPQIWFRNVVKLNKKGNLIEKRHACEIRTRFLEMPANIWCFPACAARLILHLACGKIGNKKVSSYHINIVQYSNLSVWQTSISVRYKPNNSWESCFFACCQQ